MGYKRQFLISFGGLKLGNHRFDFEIDKGFFEEFESSEYNNGLLRVKLEMEKQERMLTLTFDITGSLEVICDRCLDPFPLAIAKTHRLFVKFGSESQEESEDVIVIREGETRFDVSQYIYEYIVLSVPIRHVHPDDEEANSGCNPEFLKRLNELKPTEKSDPRWDALKELKR